MSWGDAFKAAWNKATDAACDAAGALATGAKKAAGWVKEKASNVADWSKQKYTDAKNKVTETANWVKKKTDEVKEWTKKKASQVADWAKKTSAKISNTVHTAYNKIKQVFNEQVAGRIKQVCMWLKEDDVARQMVNELTLAQLRALSNYKRQELKDKLTAGLKSDSDDEMLVKIWRAENELAINQALKDQRSLLDAKKKELEQWNDSDKANFKKWFGTSKEEDRKTMQDRVDKMLELNNNTTIENFYPPEDSKDNRYAYVYRGDKKHKIYLDKAFHKASATGQDSKAGILAHEMSHFSDIGDTDDHVYGVSKAKKLAQDDPDDAMTNADNFEYYVENVH